MGHQVVIFSDLDGCLLNKTDYSFADAIPTLIQIRSLRIPLVLASSKTESEMRRLADEMDLQDAPMICENGGLIIWSRDSPQSNQKPEMVLGVERSTILETLQKLKHQFRFESFVDLGLEGVCTTTGLTTERARAALDRCCTEPLLWRDDDKKLIDFQTALEDAALTLTRGGRFWHVAGQIDKGTAMRRVIDQIEVNPPRKIVSIAIGDSPIDQRMLDIADYPIAIPTVDGVVHVQLHGQNSRVAKTAGAAGWADSVSAALDELT